MSTIQGGLAGGGHRRSRRTGTSPTSGGHDLKAIKRRANRPAVLRARVLADAACVVVGNTGPAHCSRRRHPGRLAARRSCRPNDGARGRRADRGARQSAGGVPGLTGAHLPAARPPMPEPCPGRRRGCRRREGDGSGDRVVDEGAHPARARPMDDLAAGPTSTSFRWSDRGPDGPGAGADLTGLPGDRDTGRVARQRSTWSPQEPHRWKRARPGGRASTSSTASPIRALYYRDMRAVFESTDL